MGRSAGESLACGPLSCEHKLMDDLFARIDNAGFEEGLLSQDILTTSLGNAINWARKNSIWPMSFGLACCHRDDVDVGLALRYRALRR